MMMQELNDTEINFHQFKKWKKKPKMKTPKMH